MISGYVNLDSTLQQSYREGHFGHFSIQTLPNTYIPYERLVNELDRISGKYSVEEFEARLVLDTGIQVLNKKHGFNTSLAGRVVAWNYSDSPQPAVNGFQLLQGSLELGLEAKQPIPVLAETHFYQFWELDQGDQVFVFDGSQFVAMNVSGEVFSPEYVWPAKSLTELSASARTFGVLFIDLGSAQSVFNLSGRVNEMSVRLKGDPTYSEMEQVGESVLEELRQVFGSTFQPVQTRENQPSHAIWTHEMSFYQELSTVMPAILLFIGAAGIYVSVSRVVKAQRRIIAISQSLGYGSKDITLHYLEYAVLVGVLGTALGSILGVGVAYFISRLYVAILGLPDLGYVWSVSGMVQGFAIAVPVSAIAGFLPLVSLLREPPAQAIVDDAGLVIEKARRSVIEWFFHRWRFRKTTIIPLRNAFRNRRRSFSSVLGVMFSVTILIAGLGVIDGARWAVNTQFSDESLNFDFRVIYTTPKVEIDPTLLGLPLLNLTDQEKELFQSFNLTSDLQSFHQKGYMTETQMIVPIQFYNGERANDFSLLEVFHVNDSNIPLVVRGELEKEGILLTRTQMGNLGVDVGDELTVTVPEVDLTKLLSRQLEFSLTNKTVEVVGEIYDVNARLSAMTTESAIKFLLPPIVQLLISDPSSITLANVVLLSAIDPTNQLSPQQTNDLRQELLGLGGIQTIDTPEEIRADFIQYVGLLDVMTLIFGTAAWIIALALIYNTTSANISERRREIATMQTVGLSDWTVFLMVTFENLLTASIGILAGIPSGLLLLQWLVGRVNNILQIPVQLSQISWLFVTIGVVLVILVSEYPSLRSVFSRNLASETKAFV